LRALRFERVNRARDADRVLFAAVKNVRLTEAATVRIFATPLSDEAITRCRAKARAWRST
jgi:hypothetical protein